MPPASSFKLFWGKASPRLSPHAHARMRPHAGSLQRLLGGAVVLGLLASVAGDLTAEDLVYSDAWGTQSACSGCSYVKGHVVEKPQEEVLQIDCICPPQVLAAPAPAPAPKRPRSPRLARAPSPRPFPPCARQSACDLCSARVTVRLCEPLGGLTPPLPVQPTPTSASCVCASQFDWWWNLQCAKNLSFSVSGCDSGAQWDLVAGNFSGLVGPRDNAAGALRALPVAPKCFCIP